MKKRLISLSVVCLIAGQTFAQQMFKPAAPNQDKLSAYLIPPGNPASGWVKDDQAGHGNCQLAGYVLVGSAGAAPIETVSYTLPKSEYDVSVCFVGSGAARIAGTPDWVPLASPDNYFRFVRIGSVSVTETVTVEVKPGSKFRYAGLLLEGDILPVLPVDTVLHKLETGQPVTICLLGDSVTENAKGHRGGSSAANGRTAFENGNPGLLKNRLEKQFKTEVSYISHREPEGWPEDGNTNQIKMVAVDGKMYRDGRVPFDETKKIHLVNIGKGGAASDDGWYRCQPEFSEANDWRKDTKGKWVDTSDTKLPRVLRIGLLGYKPDLAIINFGTNDANGSHTNWTAADYIFHMKVLVTLLQHNGVAVIVSTPHKWTKGTHQSPNTQVEMAQAIRKYAAGSGLRLADIYNEYALGEGSSIHPDNTGHAHIAEAYMKAILGQQSVPVPPTASAAAEQFKDNRDGTVTDAKTALVWMKNADLAGKKMTLAEAKTLLAGWNLEQKFGRSDWRMPTMMELLMLTGSSPSVPAGAPFENVARQYLTGSVGMSLKDRGDYIWLVDMQFGQEYFSTKTSETETGFLWPVSGQKQ